MNKKQRFRLNKKSKFISLLRKEMKKFNYSLTDPQSYNPAKTNYDPINDACWKFGDKLIFTFIFATFLK